MTSADQTKSIESRRGRNFVLWLPLVAVLIFLLFQLALLLTVDLPEYDEAVHLNIARSIRRTGIAYRLLGHGALYTIHTPLYQYFLGLSTLIFGENLVVLRLLTVGFGVGTILLCYSIGTMLRDKTTGFASALVLSLNPLFILYAYFLREEVPMLFFLMLSVHFLTRAEIQSRSSHLSWAGVCIGIAVLLKEFALVFWIAAVLFVFLTGNNRKDRLNRALLVGLPAVIALILWIVWAMAIDPRQLESAVLRWINGLLGQEVETYDPRYRVKLDEWLVTIGRDVFGWETLILLLAGFLFYIWKRRRQPRIVSLLFSYSALTLVLSLVVSLKEPRHVLGIVPMMALGINMLIDWSAIVTWLQHHRRRAILISMCFGLLIVFAWGLSPLKFPSERSWDDAESWWEPSFTRRMFATDRRYGVLKIAGDYLKEHSDPDEIIVIVHEGTVLGYYADRHYQFLYTFDYEQVMGTLENTNIFVYDQPSFFRLTEDEIDRVWAYINEYFEEEKIISDQYRDITIYRRIK